MTRTQHDQFDCMYHALFPKMMNFAGRLCKNRDEAEDVIQEAFIKAFAAFDKVENTHRIDNWLMRIVYNTFLDTRRKQGRRISTFGESQQEPGHLLDDQPDSRETPEEFMMGKTISKEMLRALNRLDTESREIFCQVYLDQVDQGEVSRTYGIQIGTLRSRLFRIATRLRKDLSASRAA